MYEASTTYLILYCELGYQSVDIGHLRKSGRIQTFSASLEMLCSLSKFSLGRFLAGREEGVELEKTNKTARRSQNISSSGTKACQGSHLGNVGRGCTEHTSSG